mmetsp:Transcript_10703/g.23217  ORF Transcript_10703/g.23217 Transcript_10703/m.23217 type:complete len:1490 (-) Transcript_10703:187-4656(-)
MANAKSSQKPSAGHAPAGTGSNPPAYRYKKDDDDDAESSSPPLPVPWWFNPATAELFHSLPMEDDDVIVSSGVKMGTSWLTNLLVSLLYEYDDDGKLISEAVANREKIPGRLGQTYPDSLYPTRAAKDADEQGIYKRMPQGRKILDDVFGDFVWEDLVRQPRPRMFASHLFGRKYLPRELFDDDEDAKRKGKGRLIVVVRNLKDTMCSLHNFRGTAIDGWLGNEHGPGSFRRWVTLDGCPNAMGSAFHWVREAGAAVEHIGKERALVVHYESLILNFAAQLVRINSFLGLPDLAEAKARAIEVACSLDTMASSNLRTRRNCRKGGICGWRDIEVGDDLWAEFDDTFNEVLAGVEMAEPMRFFQWKDVPGRPPSSSRGCDADADPRKWPSYLLVMLKEGMVVPDLYFLGKDRPTPTTEFRSSLYSSEPSLDFDARNVDGSSRYHLFLSASCPLASAVGAARSLLGLEDAITVDVADGQSSAGWVFLNGSTCPPWKGREGPFWLYEAYQLADPLCTTIISVPVLFDTVTQKIVSNDSWEVIKLISGGASRTDFNVWRNPPGVIAKEGLFPIGTVDDAEKMFSHLQANLFTPTETAGVECLRSGNAESPIVIEARKKVFKSLEELEGLLGQNRFLLGNDVTAVDIHLATFLFAFDACYYDAHALRMTEGNHGPVLTGDGHPNLKAYSREMYRLLKSTLNFASFRHGFRLAHAVSLTRQSYSRYTVSAGKLTSSLDEELPDLNDIVSSLEVPAGDRPSCPLKESAPPPNKIKCEGVPMPFFFRQDSYNIFRDMDVMEDDIFLSSGVKMGTTWVNKILNTLLHDFDEDGNKVTSHSDDSLPNRLGQSYPEAMPPTREVEQQEREQGKGKKWDIAKTIFGDFTLDDLLGQTAPRLFSTHLFGQRMLPTKLFDVRKTEKNQEPLGKRSFSHKGKGRLIVVVRNLKDTLVSLHHFQGVPKDGWYGNEHGPGSLRRYLDVDDCPNAYGSTFNWVKASAAAVNDIGPERSLVICYEALKNNFDAQLRRINDFLGLPPLSKAKTQAISEACSAKNMKTQTGARFKSMVRKGAIGDWTNYLDEIHWEKVDRTFSKVLSGVELAEPLRFFQFEDIPGMPLLSAKECDLNTDPRSWPPPLLVKLREGMIVPDPYFLNKNTPQSTVVPTQFKSTIRPECYLRLEETGNDGSPRFHLFLAGSCPLASSVAAARILLGLENLISMDTSDGQSGAGWVFLKGVTCCPWKEREGPFWLYEAYQLADPLCTTSISVPLLWDTVAQKIVSNDSWEIMKMLSGAASDLGFCSSPDDVLHVIAKQDQNSNIPTLFPDCMEQDIEQMHVSTVKPLLDGVETGFEYLRNGYVETQLVLEGRNKVFVMLEELEELLGDRSFLLHNLTGVDVRLAFCLLQFDACYWDKFELRSSEKYRGPILTGDIYPNLKAYLKGMYRLMKPAVHFESFRQLYRLGHAIEFTRQSYSRSAVASDKALNGMKKELPNLNDIVSSLA